MVNSIQSAIASIADSLPDASVRMRCGESVGVVLSASSRELSGETVSADAPQEMRRVVGRRCDFPSVAKGSCVTLGDGGFHIVTSCRTDPVGASVTVGLSASLESAVAAYRRPGTKIRQAVEVLAVESDIIEPNGDAFAPTASRRWFVAIAEGVWYEPTEPQVGDELTLDAATVRVSAVAKRDGFWILTCRARR